MFVVIVSDESLFLGVLFEKGGFFTNVTAKRMVGALARPLCRESNHRIIECSRHSFTPASLDSVMAYVSPHNSSRHFSGYLLTMIESTGT